MASLAISNLVEFQAANRLETRLGSAIGHVIGSRNLSVLFSVGIGAATAAISAAANHSAGLFAVGAVGILTTTSLYVWTENFRMKAENSIILAWCERAEGNIEKAKERKNVAEGALQIATNLGKTVEDLQAKNQQLVQWNESLTSELSKLINNVLLEPNAAHSNEITEDDSQPGTCIEPSAPEEGASSGAYPSLSQEK